MSTDARHMNRALSLARRGFGLVSPNPMVGAVIVKDGVVVGEGWHRVLGADHAEIVALKQAQKKAKGADVFVNLEPCCHHGRTPPCAQALIDAGVRRVVVAMVDPNPLVSGKGIKMMADAGILVEVGLKEKEARELNQAFAKWIVSRRPFVTLKMAATLDGRTAQRDGKSRWITCAESRKIVHRLRAGSDAILVGAGTVRADDPLLLPVDYPMKKAPLRVVVSSFGDLPLNSKLFSTTDRGPVAVALGAGIPAPAPAPAPPPTPPPPPLPSPDPPVPAPGPVPAALSSLPIQVINAPAPKTGVDLESLLDTLGQQGIASVLCEGGHTLAASLLRAKLVDKLELFIAPKMLGDPDAKPLVADLGITQLDQALGFKILRTSRCGPDIRIEMIPTC